MKTGNRLESFGGHTYFVDEVAFSPDGAHLVTASGGGTARLWTLRPPSLIGVLEGHDENQMLPHLAFDPTGRHLATVSWDGTVRLWDGRTGEPEHVLSHEGVDYVAFDGAGKRLITTAGNARVWEVATGRLLTILKGEENAAERAVLNDDGTRALTYTWLNSVSLWDTQTGRRLNTFRVGELQHSGAVLDIAFTPDGPRVLTWQDPDEAVILWDAETGKPLKTLTEAGGLLASGRFSAQGTHLITEIFIRPGPATAHIWEAGSGVPVMTLESEWQFTDFLEFDWTRRHLIAAHGSEAWIGDLASGRRRQILGRDLGTIITAAHPGNRPDLAFTALESGGALLWDVPTGTLLRDFSEKTVRIWRAAINRDGSRIATASDDNRIRLWEVAPIYRAELQEQVRMACAMAARTGVDSFSEDEMLEPVLRGRDARPCAGRTASGRSGGD